MAEMLGVPYKTVAFAAIIPALAYYGSVFFLVTFMAKKEAIDSDKEAVKNCKKISKAKDCKVIANLENNL